MQMQQDVFQQILKIPSQSQCGYRTINIHACKHMQKKSSSLWVYSLLIAEKGSVKVVGEDRLAFKGQSVLFECQAPGWFPQPTLQWLVNGKKVSTYTHLLTRNPSSTSRDDNANFHVDRNWSPWRNKVTNHSKHRKTLYNYNSDITLIWYCTQLHLVNSIQYI